MLHLIFLHLTSPLPKSNSPVQNLHGSILSIIKIHNGKRQQQNETKIANIIELFTYIVVVASLKIFLEKLTPREKILDKNIEYNPTHKFDCSKS
jgi:hypothetical protein